MINATFVKRAFRNFFLERNHPFFAHFFVTERCNLRCAYCEVYKKPSPELDERDAKTVIDRIAEMGVAMLSFTGGEPLLREDLPDLVEYAKAKRFVVKLTSNGTMPRNRYERLLQTSIDAVHISMDGFGGHALPLKKIDPRIMETLHYLYEHRMRKRLYVSTVYYDGNGGEIEALAHAIGKSFPEVRLLIQPIMVGSEGAFRSKTFRMGDASLFLKISRRDNIVNPPCYNEHCARYLKAEGRYPWGCKAGRLFFDIKPNGDFWICQDRPSGLNILDTSFPERWRALDFASLIEGCPGCTYSCYFLTQKSFEPRYILGAISRANRL